MTGSRKMLVRRRENAEVEFEGNLLEVEVWGTVWIEGVNETALAIGERGYSP